MKRLLAVTILAVGALYVLSGWVLGVVLWLLPIPLQAGTMSLRDSQNVRPVNTSIQQAQASNLQVGVNAQ